MDDRCAAEHDGDQADAQPIGVWADVMTAKNTPAMINSPDM
jgi:hypothetical protein